MFCFSVNNKPFGDLVSKNIFVNRLTSVIALMGAVNPPRRRESGPAVLKSVEGSESSEGIGVVMYGWLLKPPPGLSKAEPAPNLRDFKSVFRFIKGIY